MLVDNEMVVLHGSGEHIKLVSSYEWVTWCVFITKCGKYAVLRKKER